MKFFTLIAVYLLSFNALAFSSIELKKDVVLEKTNSGFLMATLSEGKGNDYCQISVVAPLENENTLTVSAGTIFKVDSVVQNGCGKDWGRVCRLDLNSQSIELEKETVQLLLTCKDKGLLAKKLTPSKVNKIAGKLLNVR